MELSSASLKAIEAEIKTTQAKLLSLMMDYALYEGLDSKTDKLLLMALSEAQGWEDSTCSITELLAPDYPVSDCDERVLANQEIVDNWYRCNVEEVDS